MVKVKLTVALVLLAFAIIVVLAGRCPDKRIV